MHVPIQPAATDFEPRPVPGAQAALVLIGFSAVIGQVLLLRELIVVFNGNEMSLGIIMATWLFWTAAGSGLSSRIALEESSTRRLVAALNCLLALSLPLTIFALRASKSWLQAVPGQLISPAFMALASLACLSLFCLVTGALFASAARLLQQSRRLSSQDAAGSAYMAEAVGSAIGGILVSLLLLRALQPLQIAAMVALLNLWMAAVLLLRPRPRQFAVLAGIAFLLAIPLLSGAAPMLEQAAQALLWRGFHLLESRDSIYGNLAVTQTGDIRSLYSNGVLLANAPDPGAAEEGVHYALLEHPSPRRILMIGGGINGSVAQALQHPSVKRIDYVELDPALIAMARQFFPSQSGSLFSDPRVHLHYADGRTYLLDSKDRFDVILVNVPDPQTAQLNRFYTVEFFRSARDHLAPGGLLALELRSSEENLSPELADFLRCIQLTLQQAFPHIAVLPGDTLHFFASADAASITEDPQTLIARMRERHLKTQYVREYFIPFRMMPDRMDQVHAQLRPIESTPINHDLQPIAYYLNIVLWTAQFNPSHARWFFAAARVDPSRVTPWLLAALLLAAILVAFVPARRELAPAAALLSVAATGFTLMALQVFLLLAFQAIYGYLYHQLAILIGLGMAGIAIGTWLGMRTSGSNQACRRLASIQLLLAASSPLLICAVTLLARLSGATATWLAAQCAFPALAALCGMLGGYQFPLAANIYLKDAEPRRSLGALYAVDLLGGCVCALLLGTYLIPVFGFWRTAWLCAAINLAPALLAARASMAAE